MWYHSLSLKMFRAGWCFHSNGCQENTIITVHVVPSIEIKCNCSSMVILLYPFQVVDGHLVVQRVTAEEVVTKLPLSSVVSKCKECGKSSKDLKNVCEKSVYYGKVNKALYNDTIKHPWFAAVDTSHE